jgi:outer membrane murein-binding lipoprotein Lpp
MITVTPKWQIWILMILLVSVSIPAMGHTSASFAQSGGTDRPKQAEADSISRARLSNVNDVAKLVDSLQFVVVYNAELLRQDLGSKVIWIYVMLGVMIVASMMMFGGLSQAQRQRKMLEERVYGTLSTSVANLEAKIRELESKIDSPAHPRRSASPKKKKTS